MKTKQRVLLALLAAAVLLGALLWAVTRSNASRLPPIPCVDVWLPWAGLGGRQG